MPRVMLLPAMGLAHVTRTLTLAAELQADHEVEVGLSAAFLPLAEEVRVPTRVLDVPPVDYGRLARGDLQWDGADQVERSALAYAEAIESFAADVVVTSMALAARIPIRARGVPHVTFFDACNHPQFRRPVTPGEERDRRARGERLRELLDVVGGRLGAPPERSSRLLFVGDLTLLPDLPFLFPIEDLPHDFAYVGPLAWRDAGAPIDPGVRVNPDEPLVYVTMGSSGNRDHLRRLAAALHHCGHQVVLTTGSVLDPDELAAYERPGFQVRGFVPGEAVMAASSKTVVVCHGGMGTVYQALTQQVHGLLLVPAHRQHQRIARRLEELGLGRALPAGEIDGVAAAVDERLALPPHQHRAEITAEMHAYPGAPRGRRIIDDFLRRRGVNH